jgi:NAD(P)-dependent dehydrogenase (short-subunit alcohol dehydrogenase family)
VSDVARSVLVTGANSGLGLAIAIELARRGHHTIGTVRSPQKAKVLHEAAGEVGVEIEAALLDVTDAEGCASIIDRFRPEVLVNNAGYGLSAPMESVPDEDAEQLLATMLIAPMRLARLSLPHMRAAGWGRIVNISSILGRITMPLSGWYQAAKHGLEAATDALRIEVARDGITVVLVEPGLFRTAIFDDLAADQDRYAGERYGDVYDRLRDAMSRGEPFMGDPATVAKTVAKVVAARQPRARYLVGTDAQWLDAVRGLTPTQLQDRLARLMVGL